MTDTQNNSLLPGYEATVVTRTNMTDDALKVLIEKLYGVVKSFKGEVLETEDWGKKRLAYNIQKEVRGHYTYFVFNGTQGVVEELERNMRIQENVLRYLTVKLEDEFDFPKFKKNKELARERIEEERKFAEKREFSRDRY